MRSDLRSHYWDYIKFYNDKTVWDKTVLFESFNGRNFQGNPYYLYKELFRRGGDLRLTVAHRDPEVCRAFLRNKGLLDERTSVILYGSREYREVLGHAKYLVNNVSFPMDWIKKEDQVYLNTWHGTPLKTLGRNVKNDPFELNNAQRNMLLADYLLAPNVLTEQVLLNDYMIHGIQPGELISGGYPRNAVFFDSAQRELVRERMELREKTAIFYMPTWRGTGSGTREVDVVSDMERLAEDLGEGYRIFIKLHPAMKQSVQGLRRCFEMPADYEVYEFLQGMDVLITDYSSVYFDYAVTGRKTVLYQYDLQEYAAQRGIYPQVLRDTPYPVAHTYEELKNLVITDTPVNDEAFKRAYCPYESPEASAVLLDKLFSGARPETAEAADLYVIDFPVSDEQLLRWQEQLKGQNFRFVFVPRRSNKGFRNVGCFEQIDYLVCFRTGRRTLWERFFPGRKTGLRERRRLWGGLKVRRIYARSRHVPLPLREGLCRWPENLN